MSKLQGPPAQTQAAEAAPAPPPAYGAAAMVDLEDLISWNGCEVLNAVKKDSLGNCLKKGLRDQEALLCESDADEQLLINIAFKSKVKLHGIAIAGPPERAPKKIRLFVNRTQLSFDDAEGAPAEQEMELEAEMLGERIDLRFVKFQSVDRLTLFVASNQGDEESSALSLLKLYGAPIGVTNMAEFKRVAGNAGEGE